MDRINPVQHSEYHGCWCPVSLCRQVIRSHAIRFVEEVGFCLTWGRISTTCVMSVWSNDLTDVFGPFAMLFSLSTLRYKNKCLKVWTSIVCNAEYTFFLIKERVVLKNYKRYTSFYFASTDVVFKRERIKYPSVHCIYIKNATTMTVVLIYNAFGRQEWGKHEFWAILNVLYINHSFQV